jgi:hypothetical protein
LSPAEVARFVATLSDKRYRPLLEDVLADLIAERVAIAVSAALAPTNGRAHG